MIEEEINLILVTPHGRSGSLFIQSLMDGHTNIASIPGFGLNYDINLKVGNKTELVDNFISKHPEIFDLSLGYLGQVGTNVTEKLGFSEEKNLRLDKEAFRNLLLQNLNSSSEIKSINISRRDFWIAVHKSYVQLLGNDPSQLKYILFHQHNYIGGHQFASADFPQLHYFATIRDPREDWLSWKKVLRIRHGRLFFIAYRYFRYQNLMSYSKFVSNLVEATEYITIENILILDLNTLHSLNVDAMREICRRLKIDFQDSMTKSTFNGLVWKGNAADRKATSGFDITKKDLKWPFKLRKNEVEYINSFLNLELRSFNYQCNQAIERKKIRLPYLSIFFYSVLIQFRVGKPLDKIENRYPMYLFFMAKVYRLARSYSRMIKAERVELKGKIDCSERFLRSRFNDSNFL